MNPTKKHLNRITIIIPIVIACLLFVDYKTFLRKELDVPFDKVVVTIPKNAPFVKVLSILDENGLKFDHRRFKAYARIHWFASKIKSGEFMLYRPFTPEHVVEILTTGKTVAYNITFPEGYNIYEVGKLLEANHLAVYDTFITRCFDPDFLNRLGIRSISCEGYLFPDTYRFSKDMTVDEMIRLMVSNFERNLPEGFGQRAAAIGLTKNEVITLASIIEKETAQADERKKISGVFHSRLKRGMKLQSDPTIIYGIDNYDGNIKRKHIRAKTPYNTYVIKGLPEGPIANPGREAIEAALYPAQTPYLYFVSKNDGTHYFSKTLKEHQAAVRKYQLTGGK